MIKLHQMQDAINLFDGINAEAQLPAQYYECSRYISWSEFDAMQVYELDFEPYLTIAATCDMRFLPYIKVSTAYTLPIAIMLVTHRDGRLAPSPCRN